MTGFSGDAFTPFTSSSSGSSFSLLSVQETESWTEQVLSKSGKLVDGYFRKSPSADSYPRDNKVCYITCRKPSKPWWNCSISSAQETSLVILPSLHVLKLYWFSYKKQTPFQSAHIVNIGQCTPKTFRFHSGEFKIYASPAACSSPLWFY